MKPLTKIYWSRFALGIIAALICIGYGFATGFIYTNLVFNRSGEDGDTTPQYWSSSNQTLTEWSTNYARTGTRSLRINVANSSAEWVGTVKQVQEKYTYHLLGFFKGEVLADQFFLAIRWFSDTEGNNQLAQDNIPISVGNYSRWTLIEKEFPAPQGTKSCAIVFGATNATGDLYGDDFEIKQPETLPQSLGLSSKLLTGVSLAIVVYILSYYVIKMKFMRVVEKPRKLFMTGIGIYFLTWLVFWILFYTLISTLL
ncbi:MAG: hypothetical protein QW386_04475 [Candidatus Bathyarchaeia archaeon]